MHRYLIGLVALLVLSGCASQPRSVAVGEFWRPISEPNTLMSPDRAQSKLDFDLSQCSCAIFPSNVSQPELVQFQPEQQRYAETSITRTVDPDDRRQECFQRPDLVVNECMRQRGWEATACSGRVPTASGGSLCTGATVTR
ncbi:MAG: lipoprotein [Alphaproteobacteria bacterium]|nr:lipoprotein [Alphaproteobacteria bacterium]